MAKRTFAQISEQKRPSTQTVLVPLDADAADAYAEAMAKVAHVKEQMDRRSGDTTLQPQLDDAESALEEAREKLEDNCAEFRFEALGSDVFDALVDAHPPTKDQKAKYRKQNPQLSSLGMDLRWNPDTFELALVEACCVEPELTEANAKELKTDPRWAREWPGLFNAAVAVNSGRRVVDLGKGSTQTLL